MFAIHSEESFLLLQQCAENSPCLLLCLQCNSEGTLWPQFLWSTCLSQSTLIVHFACITLFPWGSLLLVLIYFNFPFYFMSSFHFFSTPFVYISVKLMENEYSPPWPHAVALHPTLFVCMCPIFAYFSGSIFPPGQHWVLWWAYSQYWNAPYCYPHKPY